MKKLYYTLIALYFLFFLTGCAALKTNLSNLDACLNDPQCAKNISNTVQTIKDNPLAPISLAGMLSTLILGILTGKKLNKKKEI